MYLHFLLVFEVGCVKVGVEEHHSKGEGHDGVGRLELGGKAGIALGKPFAKDLHDPLDLLGLAGDTDVTEQLPQRLQR